MLAGTQPDVVMTAVAENPEEWMLRQIPLLAQYMELETLWKMRILCKAFRDALKPEALFWWQIVKEVCQDPPLNPYDPAVDWNAVAVALKLSQSRLEALAAHRTTAQLTSAGLKLLAIGKLDQASTLLKAANGRCFNKGEPNREQAECEYNLSLVCGMLGEVTEAETLRRQALEHFTVACGAQSPEVARTHFALGDALYVQNKLDQAQQSYERCLELATDNDETRAQTLCGLALVAAKRGNDAVAIKYLQTALDIRMRLFGEKAQETARVYVNLGAVHAKNPANKKIAQEMFQRAYEARAHSLGPAHPLSCRAKRLAELFAK